MASEVYIFSYFHYQKRQVHGVEMFLTSFQLYSKEQTKQMMLPLDFAHFGKNVIDLVDQEATLQYRLHPFHSNRTPLGILLSTRPHSRMKCLDPLMARLFQSLVLV